MWTTNGIGKEVTRSLILLLHSPWLVMRHNELRRVHDATHDYPEYIPHVTLSYNIGDFDISTLNINELPEDLALTFKFKSSLDLEWVP